ncbi:MAG: Gfo/Idh/MocA family oxidoreductase [Armatimonadota bacterium]|nr:Gfo/Idh/MocA family oxidoreductase [Armatimonadota bacterium]
MVREVHMALYRSLILGCGPRAKAHADVYPQIEDMKLVAACDLDEERLAAFTSTYGIPEGFTDYETALDAVGPDIVHVVTQPGNRVWEAECAAEAGVKAAIMEKPIAIVPSEIIELQRIRDEAGMKLIVNCQRRYFPQFRDGHIRQVMEEQIGDVYLIRASTKGNLMSMGPHTMDLLLMLMGDVTPQSVWAMAYGIDETGYKAHHRAPEHLLAEYWFPGEVRVLFDSDVDALGTPDEDSFFMHLHFDILGSTGRIYVTQNRGWWWQCEGMAQPEFGESSWDTQQRDGQRDFTAAVARWLTGGEPHLNRFETARATFDASMAALQSVYEGRRVDLPHSFTDAQWHQLRERLLALDSQHTA